MRWVLERVLASGITYVATSVASSLSGFNGGGRSPEAANPVTLPSSRACYKGQRERKTEGHREKKTDAAQ
jgi:hypothetical protein